MGYFSLFIDFFWTISQSQKYFLKFLLVSGVSFWLVGCSVSPSKPMVPQKQTSPIDLANHNLVQNRLKSQYSLWKGTPYKYGGSNLNGVDCSAFVQNTYRDVFGRDLPRTTKTQINKGKKVSKSNLKPGDVVFFKISKNSLHNGVYLGQSQFIHASSSKGVTISRLDNVYWKQTYYTARRMH